MLETMTGHSTVDAVSKMHFEGDITPKSWFQHIRYTTKRGTYPDAIACDLLADIVYWYRATEVRDEESGQLLGWKKRFHGDMLRRNTENFADIFGYTTKQVRESLKLLENMDLIEVHNVPVKTQFGTIPNVMHITVNPERLAEITYRVQKVQKMPETIEKSLLPISVTSSAEMGNNPCRNGKQPVPKWETTRAEMGNSSICRDLLETTVETTLETIPPIPPRGVCESNIPFITAELVEEEDKQELVDEALTYDSLPKVTALQEDKSSGRTRNTSVFMNNATQRYDDRMRAGNYLPSYRTGRGYNEVKPEFLDWLCVRVMPGWTPYKTKTPEPRHARSWIWNKEKEGGRELVEDYYQGMLQEKAEPQRAEILNSQNVIQAAKKESERLHKIQDGLDNLKGL